MIRLRYQARGGWWWVDMWSIHRTRDQQRAVLKSGRDVLPHNGALPRKALWTGPWRTARGAATLNLTPGS